MKTLRHLLPVLLVVSLGGCMDGSPNESPSRDPNQLVAFSATYDFATYRLQVKMDQPREVLDADLRLVPAYPMEIWLEDTGGMPDHVVYWLSGDLRVIRVDIVCNVEPCRSEAYRPISWAPRGYWPPLGYAASLLVQAGVQSQVQWGIERHIDAMVTRDDSSTELGFRGGSNPAWAIVGIPYLPFARTYRYSGSSPIPDTMESEGIAGQRSSLTLGSPLPPIEPLRQLQPREKRVHGGQWFPGSDQPVLDNPFTLDDAVERLRQDSQEFANRLESDCLDALSQARGYTSSEVAGLDPARTTTWPFQATTYAPSASQAWTWDWEYRETFLGSNWSHSPPEGSDAFPVRQCDPSHVLPATAWTLQGFVDEVNSFPWESGKEPVIWGALFEAGPSRVGFPNPVFDILYSVSYAGDVAQGFFPSGVVGLPTVGAFLQVGGTEQELSNLPGAYGPNA